MQGDRRAGDGKAERELVGSHERDGVAVDMAGCLGAGEQGDAQRPTRPFGGLFGLDGRDADLRSRW